MADALTGITQVPQAVNNFYDKRMLMRAVPYFVHTLFGQPRDIPQNETDVIKFRRYGNLFTSTSNNGTTALTEGVTPAGSALSVTDVTATIAQYGDFVTLTDKLQFTTVDPLLTETAGVLGDQAGDALDKIARDILAAGTSVSYVASGSVTPVSRVTVDATCIMTKVAVMKSVRTLKNNLAKRITQMINASTGIGTNPVNRAFIGIVHPNTTYDIKNISGFVSIENYSSQVSVLENEIGKIDEVRFIESPNAKVFTGAGAAAIDVYVTLIFGMEAYGVTRIAGKALENIVQPLGSAGAADPLKQRATSGWKATFVAKILNNAFMTRLEHAVSA